MATLLVLQGGKAVARPIGEGETVLGRHPACTIQLDSNTVSRRHSQIINQNGQYFIEDMGSGNGTFVNGKQITQRTLLNHDDRIKLGPLLLRFQGDGAAIMTQAERASIPRTEALAETSSEVDVVEDAADLATITSTLIGSAGMRFGVLDVQPEAKLKAVLEISRSLAGSVDLKGLYPK